MIRRPVHRSYIADQARELADELGVTVAPSDASPRAHDLLEALHAAARDRSMPEGLRALLRAEAKLLAGRFDDAERQLKAIAEGAGVSGGVRGLALDRLGDIEWWRGGFAEAAALYRRSLELRPDDHRTRKDLARALWHLGEASATNEAFGGGAGLRVEAPPGDVVQSRHADDIAEVFGLYVSGQGAGAMVLQGCLDDTPGMVATGSLGAMAQEACDLAWSIWRRTRSESAKGVRVHAPQAGVLKDGPSLGLAVYTLFGAILGQLRPEPGDAFTGEIDLKGRVLPVGGARDKALAAYLTGLRRVFLPRDNLAELGEGFDGILDVRPISHVSELSEALQ